MPYDPKSFHKSSSSNSSIKNTPEWNQMKTRVNKHLNKQREIIEQQNAKIEALIDIINQMTEQDNSKRKATQRTKNGKSLWILVLAMVIVIMAIYIYMKC